MRVPVTARIYISARCALVAKQRHPSRKKRTLPCTRCCSRETSRGSHGTDVRAPAQTAASFVCTGRKSDRGAGGEVTRAFPGRVTQAAAAAGLPSTPESVRRISALCKRCERAELRWSSSRSPKLRPGSERTLWRSSYLHLSWRPRTGWRA